MSEKVFHATAWSRHDGETNVECPACGFCFGADHEDTTGGYSCPACAEIALTDALKDLLHWANQCPTLTNVDLMPGWWVSGRMTRKRAEDLTA